MKKKLITIVFIAITLNSYCVSEPIQLITKGNTIENLIPANWKLLASVDGDLNRDGINDLVFVIENSENSKIHVNESGLGRDSINLNPRILGIYFRKKNGKLIKKLQSDGFIILQDSPTMDEPFDGFEILESGILQIHFKFWFSAGSYSMSNHTYNFRFQNKRFELIEYESSERHRGTGETVDCIINFATGKMIVSKMTIDDNNIETKTEENIGFKLNKLRSLTSLGKPFEWAFNGTFL